MQKSHEHKQFVIQSSPKLPENFAQQVMDLELEVEVNPRMDMEKINKLVELYSAAVEYYQSIKSNNYLVFKNKIVSLMMKPLANSKPSKEQKQVGLDNISKETTKNQKAADLKREELQQTVQVATNISQLNAKRMLIGADTQLENVAKKIDNQITKQQLRIEERLRMRKGKTQVISIESTESDPKQKQARQKDDIFCFEIILEANDPIQEERNQQKSKVEQPPIIVKTNAQITQQKLPDIKPAKPKAKKQVLSLKPNQKLAKLPDQYNIPF